jgi:hypothetical protein
MLLCCLSSAEDKYLFIYFCISKGYHLHSTIYIWILYNVLKIVMAFTTRQYLGNRNLIFIFAQQCNITEKSYNKLYCSLSIYNKEMRTYATMVKYRLKLRCQVGFLQNPTYSSIRGSKLKFWIMNLQIL